MPNAEDLSDSLKKLHRRQAIEISDLRFEADVTQLTRTLAQLTEALREQEAAEEARQQAVAEAARQAEQERRAREAADAERAAREEREMREATEAAERTEQARRESEAEAPRRADEERRVKEAVQAERSLEESKRPEIEGTQHEIASAVPSPRRIPDCFWLRPPESSPEEA